LSFTDRIEQLGKELGGAALAPFKLVWDVSTSPFNDAEEFNGVSNILKNSLGNFGKSVVRPIGSLLKGIDAANRTLIREPLTTLALTSWQSNPFSTDPNAEVGNFFDSETWRKSWEARDEISLGQALAANIFSNGLTRELFDNENKGPTLFNDFDIFNEEERQKVFKENLFGKFASGSIDFTAQVFGDVTLIGGKAALAYRAGEKGINVIKTQDQLNDAIKEVKAAQDAFRNGIEDFNKYSKMIRDFRDNGVDYALSRNVVTSSDDQTTLAWLLGKSKTDDEVSFVLRSALGDKDAITELEALRPSMARALNGAMGKPDMVTIKTLSPDPDPILGRKLLTDDPDALLEASKEFNDLYANDEWFKAFIDLGRDSAGNIMSKPILRRTVGTTRVQGFEDFIAKGRITKFYDRPVGQPTVETFQPTIWNRAYAKVTWAAGERPAFHANLNDADSYVEMLAAVTRARKVLGKPKLNEAGQRLPGTFGMTEDDARLFIERYAQANTPELRARVIYQLEDFVTNEIGRKYNISSNRATEIYTGYRNGRDSAIRSFKERGFAQDIDGTKIIAPIFESQGVNILPIMDFDALDRSVKISKSILQGPLRLNDGIVDLLDVMQDLFKVGTLARLGYTTRNAIDNQLRIIASGNALSVLKNIPEGVKNVVYNNRLRTKKLVDNFKLLRAGETRVSKAARYDEEYFDLSNQLKTKQKEFNNWNKLKETYDAGPQVPEFKYKELNENELLMYQAGDIPAKEYNKIERASKKEAKTEWEQEAKNIELPVLELESFVRNIGGSMAALEDKGAIPLTKLLKALEDGKVLPEDLYAILERGVSTVDDFGRSFVGAVDEGGAKMIFAGELRRRSRTFGKGKQRWVTVDWYPTKAKSKEWIENRANVLTNRYVADDITYFQENYAAAYEKHVAKYTDEYLKLDPNIIDQQIAVLTPQVENLRFNISSLAKEIEEFKGPLKFKRVGQKDIEIQGKYQKYVAPGALGGKYGEIYRREISAQDTYKAFTNYPDYAGRNVRNKGYGTLTPKDDVIYFEEWSKNLNNVLGNSQPVKVVLKEFLNPIDGGDWGKASQKAKKWLKYSREGKLLRRRLSSRAFDRKVTDGSTQSLGLEINEVDDYINLVVQQIRQNMPDTVDQTVMRKVLADDIITERELRELYAGYENLPAINGRLLEEDLTRSLSNATYDGIDSIFNFLGTIPEDAWARFPLYDALYREEFVRQIDLIEGMAGKALTEAEQRFAEKAAREFSKKETRKILFTIQRKSNVGGLTMIRMMSPFFAAQENSYKTWARLIGRNPAILNRAQLLWTSPQRANLVTDNEGNPIEPNELTYEGTIWVNLPEGMKKIPGLQTLTTLGIPKRSLDIVMGGGFELPIGPYVAIPASEIIKRKPELEDSLRWALPFGPERNAAMAMIPTWLKRQVVRIEGQNSPEYARAYQLIWTTEQFNARRDGTPYKTPQEIQKMVDQYYNMRTIANLVLPFAARFDTPYRMYMDKWREYQREFGTDADEKFLQDYSEFFDFATSLSQNVGGVQASVDAVKAIEANDSLVADLSSIDPNLIGLIVNNPTGYDFSQAAYEWQYATPVAPGSSVTFRGTQDPVEVQKRQNAKKGWIQYRQFMSTQIEPVLVARGLASIRDKRARDLQQMRESMVSELANKNTDWYDDFLDTDGSKTNRVIRGLTRILEDEKFMTANAENPTWQSVAAYITLRNQVAYELSQREVKSLDAKANIDLANAFESAVGRLKQDDIGFSDLYERFLSQDPVYDKYLEVA
jgi:hypothetical protein